MTSGVPFLVGSSVHLRSLEPADADGPYLTWFNDPVVCEGNGHHILPFTREQAVAYIERSRVGPDLVLAIVDRQTDEHIGNVSLQGVQQVHRSAEFAIVLGSRAHWGRSIGYEAASLICRHGFRAMNLHRIEAGTIDGNEAMVRLAARLGMREEGRSRAAVFKNGSYRDVIRYGVLAEEFEAGET